MKHYSACYTLNLKLFYSYLLTLYLIFCDICIWYMIYDISHMLWVQIDLKLISVLISVFLHVAIFLVFLVYVNIAFVVTFTFGLTPHKKLNELHLAEFTHFK